ncbi:MAG: TIGR03016 family PEP-CTERM system-associated outer membrane protein [Rhodocyclales bacterium GT-UBC]|nr:MAG: TIGR03016 family PEP-CTERM system-associated outer membrane protein [Rhodocyclales bacterium GT-UBC]
MAMGTGMKTNFSTREAICSLTVLLISGPISAQQSNIDPTNQNTGYPASTNAQQSTQTVPLASLATEGKAWIIRPRISLTETYSDNVNVNRSNGGKQSDLISELAPGVRVEARTSRLNAYFDYALRGISYANESGNNQSQNSLNTFGTFEAVDKWLYLDFSGLIAQQAISAFGTQSASNATINNNTTETSTFRLSPFIKGQFAGSVDYFVRYNTSKTRSDASSVSNVDLSEWTSQIKGSTPFQRLQWAVDASRQNLDYSRGSKTEAERIRGMLTYSIVPEFRISGSLGTESNNYASRDQESRTTSGYGFDWFPTERTQVSVFKEKRFFGDGHNISISHRLPRSYIRYTDTRDVSVLPNQFGTVGLGSVYDIYYQLFSNLEPFASMTGIAKDAAVANAVSALLAQQGIAPNSQIVSGYLTSRATILRMQQLSLALTGVRNSITFAANRSESESVLATSALNDDLSKSSSVRQQGVAVTLSHRLSENAALTAVISRQESNGNSTSTSPLKSTMTSYQINASTRLGTKTSGSLSVRRLEFDNNTNPYTENALIGSISFVY